MSGREVAKQGLFGPYHRDTASPETTTEEFVDSNVSSGFLGTNYVSREDTRRIKVTKTDFLGPTSLNRAVDLNQPVFTSSRVGIRPETAHVTSERYQAQANRESLFGSSRCEDGGSSRCDGSNKNVGTYEHRTLFGSDFGTGNTGNETNHFDGRNSFGNKTHQFAASVTSSETKNSPGNLHTSVNAGYRHKPTGNAADVHANFTKSGMNVYGQGTYNINKDTALAGSVKVRQNGETWNTHGQMTYQHKPSNSEASFGVGNTNGSTDYTFGGRSKIDKRNYGLDGRVFVQQTIGGPCTVDTNLKYSHKPSDAHVNLGVLHQNGNSTVTVDVNVKNKANLGVSGHHTDTADRRSTGFQISGGF